MKQVLQNLKNGRISIEEAPIPAVRSGTALVRTAASLLSAGTERMVLEFAEKSLIGKARSRPDLVRQVFDKAIRDGWMNSVQTAFQRLDQPMTPGYSSAGWIEELGTDMDGLRVGQRVACAGAGYAVHAEYAIVPRNLLCPLPEEVDFESAAFATLGSVAMHGFRLAAPQLEESVAVIGCGLLGLLAVQIAAAAGCSVLGIDIQPTRVSLAESLGFQAISREKANDTASSFTRGRGFDVILICADADSSDPVELAGEIARDRARVVAIGAVGLNLPRKIYYEKELSFINSRSYGPGRYDAAYEEGGRDYPIGFVRWTEGRNLEAVIGLMSKGKLNVKPLITHRFPLEQAARAYDLIKGGPKESFLGVLLTYKHGKEEIEKRIEVGAASSPPTAIKRQTAGMRLGVIGAGSFANATLLPAIKKAGGIELLGIASNGGLHAQIAAKKFGFAYAASRAQELFEDPAINTIAIVTRHDSHADLAVEALKAGKHVFVEKPLAINSDQVSAIKSCLGSRESPLLLVGFNRRFAPLAIKLIAFLGDRKEPLYAHYRVNAGYLPPGHWTQDVKIGGGRIIGEGCHFIDFLSYVAGSAPIQVNARALPDNGKYCDDNDSMTFAFPDGSIGVLDYLANGDRSVPKERLEVFCGGKIAILEDFRSLELVENGKRKKTNRSQDKGWVGEWQAFRHAITHSGQPPIPYDQLIGVTMASFSAMESLRKNQSVDIQR